MYSFYGGQKGQDFKISRIFANRSVDMLGDLKMRWTSPVAVGEYVFISYGDPSYANEDASAYHQNLQLDLNACGKSYTNSLWQKIYVDKNLEVSPDFPDNDNNVYIFLNLDDSDSEEYGNSLKEVSDLEAEESFGFGYRLIACITGITPRIQVFHQTINLEDGDPYATLDLTNPDTPKIKFYLQRGQRINDVFETTIGPQEDPYVEYITDSDFTYTDKNGETQKATLTNPYVNFHLPKAPTMYVGALFGQGPISYFRNLGNLSEDIYTQIVEERYWVYKSEADVIDLISFTIQKIMRQDYVEFTYSSEDDEFTIQDGKHFYLIPPDEYSGGEYQRGVFEQSDGQVCLNILNNTELKQLAIDLKEKLTTNYSLKDQFMNKDEETETEWYFIRKEDNQQVALMDVMNKYFASTLQPISELVYALFKYFMEIETQDKYFTFDNVYISRYTMDILSKYDILKAHFEDIYNNGFIGDIYINEPTGKIYEISEIKQDHIEAMYLGTITAPAPCAKTRNVSPFYLNSKGEYARRNNYVSSNVSIDDDNKLYQEIFTFELTDNPITNFKITDTDNNKKHTIVSTTIDNEKEQTISVEAPMPIHIFTPSDEYGLYLDVNGSFAIRSGKNAIDIPMGLGDLFFNITSNNANAFQGNIYRCRMEMKDIQEGLKNHTITLKDIWGEGEPIGNLSGVPGIPIASQVVNIYSNVPETDTEFTWNAAAVGAYRGTVEGTNDNFIYYLNTNSSEYADTRIDAIISNYILTGTKIQMASVESTLPTFNINFSNGQVLLINYYNKNDELQSFWAVKVDDTWSLISFTQDSSILFSNIKIVDYSNKEYRTKGYSVSMLEPRLTTIENNLQWHDWS